MLSKISNHQIFVKIWKVNDFVSLLLGIMRKIFLQRETVTGRDKTVDGGAGGGGGGENVEDGEG